MNERDEIEINMRQARNKSYVEHFKEHVLNSTYKNMELMVFEDGTIGLRPRAGSSHGSLGLRIIADEIDRINAAMGRFPECDHHAGLVQARQGGAQ